MKNIFSKPIFGEAKISIIMNDKDSIELSSLLTLVCKFVDEKNSSGIETTFGYNIGGKGQDFFHSGSEKLSSSDKFDGSCNILMKIDSKNNEEDKIKLIKEIKDFKDEITASGISIAFDYNIYNEKKGIKTSEIILPSDLYSRKPYFNPHSFSTKTSPSWK